MIIRLAITAVILALLARGIDFGESARAIAAIDLRYLAFVLGLVAVDRCVMIWRWILLLRARDIRITASEAARLFLISSFVGSFLPAGVGADAARAYGLARDSATGSEAIASVGVDRLLGVASLILMALIGLRVWPSNERNWQLEAIAVGALILCVSAFWMHDWLHRLIPARLHGGSLIRRILRLTDAVTRYRSHSGTLVQVMAWSLVVQILRISQAYFLGLGLGMTVPYSYYLLFMPVGLLMLLLPISISGFGVPQGVIVWLLRPVGVPDAQSFALSTLIVLTGLAGNLPGLWLWLRHRREIL